MSDIENTPQPPPLPPAVDPVAATDQPSRLELLEARVAALEAQLSATTPAAAATAPADNISVTDNVLNWLRNNPVMAVIIAIVLIVLFSHLAD
ncbi:hypothetical protein [Niveispirillum irakense]|uniref:hypothetical protein n=1 Tax=Niveispirillum irakense TaxID=34011 RepID=UPI0003FF2AC7|nr:hypothetical protein [Niveispirillum irakense]